MSTKAIERLRKAGNDLLAELIANENGNGSSGEERTRMFNEWEHAVIDATGSDLQAQGEGDPVAWRYRTDGPKWFMWDGEDDPRTNGLGATEAIPLYTRPAPEPSGISGQLDVDKLIEAGEAMRALMQHVPVGMGSAGVARNWDAAKSLSSSPGVPKYAMSRDYEALYDAIVAGVEPLCTVDFHGSTGGHVYRDVCRIRRFMDGTIDFGARGICYGSVDVDDKFSLEERAAVIAEAVSLNLEWLSPSKEPETHIGKLAEPNVDDLAQAEAERNLYLISADYPDLPVRKELIAAGIRIGLSSSAPKEPASSPEVATELIDAARTVVQIGQMRARDRGWSNRLDGAISDLADALPVALPRERL